MIPEPVLVYIEALMDIGENIQHGDIRDLIADVRRLQKIEVAAIRLAEQEIDNMIPELAPEVFEELAEDSPDCQCECVGVCMICTWDQSCK